MLKWNFKLLPSSENSFSPDGPTVSTLDVYDIKIPMVSPINTFLTFDSYSARKNISHEYKKATSTDPPWSEPRLCETYRCRPEEDEAAVRLYHEQIEHFSHSRIINRVDSRWYEGLAVREGKWEVGGGWGGDRGLKVANFRKLPIDAPGIINNEATWAPPQPRVSPFLLAFFFVFVYFRLFIFGSHFAFEGSSLVHLVC